MPDVLIEELARFYADRAAAYDKRAAQWPHTAGGELQIEADRDLATAAALARAERAEAELAKARELIALLEGEQERADKAETERDNLSDKLELERALTEVTDRPIIFSAPMVRALIDGRKTMTRRILKPQPPAPPEPNCHPSHKPRHEAPYLEAYCGEPRTPQNPRGMSRNWHWWQIDDRPGPVACRVPYAPGDRLYVREAWGINDYRYERVIPKSRPADLEHEGIVYFATETDSETQLELLRRPSIHMPRWASRLTLTVTEVRVQRLQDISESDAQAEGIERLKSGRGFYDPTVSKAAVRFGEWTSTARQGFCRLWNSLHGPDAWDANAWVVAVTFTVRQENIDRA